MTVDEIIFNSEQRKDYIAACKEYIKYVVDTCHEPPHDISVKYYKSLKRYTDLLIKHNVLMTKPIFNYNRYDESTWKYIAAKLMRNGGCMWIQNSNWKYGKRFCT